MKTGQKMITDMKRLFDEWWEKIMCAYLVTLEIYYLKIGHFKIPLIEVWCDWPYLSFFCLSSYLSVRQTTEARWLAIFFGERKRMFFEVSDLLRVVFLGLDFGFSPSIFYIFWNKTRWLTEYKHLWND